MKIKIKFIIIFFCLSNMVDAQTIEMNFPKFAGKTFEFIIFQGDKLVKVYENDTIPKNGLVKIDIPKEFSPYKGMCRWLITNSAEGGGLDMAIPGYGFKVTCFSEKPDETNIIYEGFDSVNELNRLNKIQQKIIDKFETMNKAIQLYDTNHPLYFSFQKELEIQKEAYKEFYNELKANKNYNAKILPIINLISGNPDKLTNNYEEKAQFFNQYITNELNFDDLYTSGHWTGIIQSWVQMHAQMFQNKNSFLTDFTNLTNRINDPNKFTDFVGKVTYYLTLYGKDDFVQIISSVVTSSGKTTSYEGKTMQVYKKILVGIQAPDIVISKKSNNQKNNIFKKTILKSEELANNNINQTLLIFYQSGCGPCDDLMQLIQQQYQLLKEKGIRVITISGDESEYLFKNSSKNFPWTDKYCDFVGKNGINFKNYAVIGTPSLFLLDKNGIILKSTARLEDILSL
jgi:thioredoxin-related protein